MELDFFRYATAFYQRRYEAQEIAFHTYSGALSMIHSFQLFCQLSLQREFLSVKEINADLLEEYKQYCVGRGNRTRTVNRKLVPLILTMKEAGKESLVNNRSLLALEHAYYPSHPRRYGLEESRLSANDQEEVHYLNDRQLSALLHFYRETRRESVRNALDLFFFSFYACGLRVSDIITLEWRHVDLEQARLSKLPVKSKSAITIPLSDPAQGMLCRWAARRGASRFVFGLLPEDFDLTDDVALSRAIDHRNRTLRGVLVRIGRHLEFPFPLTMHVARHSFAVKALNDAQLNVHMISRLLGHSSVLVTEKVYARFLLSTLTHEVREKLSFPEWDTDVNGEQ